MIEVDNISKYYGNKKAVDRVSFTAGDGEVLGFLGPNGAGKSTTMNILTGYISSTSGRTLVNGIDVLENPIEAKKNIGYLPEQPPVYMDMTVDEYLKFVYGLKKCRLPRESHLREICDLVKIGEMRKRLIGNLSKGYRQRVGIAQALVGNPSSIILDEPTVGLDPTQIIEIRALIRRLGESHTVILSSHILQEIEAVCDRIVIINNGRVAANDTAKSLSEDMEGNGTLTIHAETEKYILDSLLKKVPNIKKFRLLSTPEPSVLEYEITPEPNMDIRRDISAALSKNHIPILMMKINRFTLEDVFLKITSAANEPSDNYNAGENTVADIKNDIEPSVEIDSQDSDEGYENNEKEAL